MSRALPGCCRHVDARGGFKEVPRKMIHWVAESDNASRQPAPTEVEDFEDRAHNVSEGTGRIETIRNCKGVEHGTDIPQVKLCREVTQVSPCATFGNAAHPGHQSRGNSRVVRMQAQRACCREAVESYKRERTPMRFSIGGYKLALHEAHVGVEIVRSTVTSVQVRPGSGEDQISLCDNTAEVRDEGWVMTATVDRAWSKAVDGGAEGSS